MAIFAKRKSATATIESELATLCERRAATDTRLVEARAALAASHDQRRSTLLDSDLSDQQAVARRDEECRRCESQLTGLEDASVTLDERITDAEQRLDDERDRVAREREATKRNAEAAAIEAAVSNTTVALRQLGDALEPVAPAVSFDAVQLRDFVTRGACEIEAAGIATVAAVRSYVTRITASKDFEIIRESVPIVAPPAPPPPVIQRTQVLVRQNSRWSEFDGQHTAPANAIVDLPADVAAIALKNNTAVDPRGEVAAKLLAAFGVVHGMLRPEECLDLEHAGKPSGVMHTAVDDGIAGIPGAIVTTGPSRNLEISVSRR